MFAPSTGAWDTGWKRDRISDYQEALARTLSSSATLQRPAILETLLRLQQRQNASTTSSVLRGGGLAQLPVSVIRTICQQLSHADIEQCRLVCSDWRLAFGQASVTDMYLAMCADFQRASDLTHRFVRAYPNFFHLHFWIPGGPVRQMMGTDGTTFNQYMELFSACPAKVLTAHYLDDQICPVQGITKLSGLTKLELVDLMPASASLACLSALTNLRHLIVEYKDSGAPPDLACIGQLHTLTHLELALHSTFVSNPVYMTVPARSSSGISSSLNSAAAALQTRPASEWLSFILASGDDPSGLGGADGQRRLEAIMEAILTTAPVPAAPASFVDEALAMVQPLPSVSSAVADLGQLDQPLAEMGHLAMVGAQVLPEGVDQGTVFLTLAAETADGQLVLPAEPALALASGNLLLPMLAEAVTNGGLPMPGVAEPDVVGGSSLLPTPAESTASAYEELLPLVAGAASDEVAAGLEEAVGRAAGGEETILETAVTATQHLPVPEWPDVLLGEGLLACPAAAAGEDASEIAAFEAEGKIDADAEAACQTADLLETQMQHAVVIDQRPLDCSTADRAASTVPVGPSLLPPEPAGMAEGVAVEKCTAGSRTLGPETAGRDTAGQGAVQQAAPAPLQPTTEPSAAMMIGTSRPSISDDGCGGGVLSSRVLLVHQLLSHPVFIMSDDDDAASDSLGLSSASATSESDSSDCESEKGGDACDDGASGVLAGAEPGPVGGELHDDEGPPGLVSCAMPSGVLAPAAVTATGEPVLSIAVASSSSLPDLSSGSSEPDTPMDPGLVAWMQQEEEQHAAEAISDTMLDALFAQALQLGPLPVNPHPHAASLTQSASAALQTAALAAESVAAAGVDAGPSSLSAASTPAADCNGTSPEATGSGGGDGPSALPMRMLAVSAADYLLANMIAHWSKLRSLQRLELRSAPVGLARCYPLLFSVLPSLTDCKLVGPDGRLKVYGPSQPAFKVEVSRDAVSLALAPATLALSLHCDTPGDTSAALQQLALVAASVAPASSNNASAVATAAAARQHTAQHIGSSSVGAAGGSNRQAAWAPWNLGHSNGETPAARSTSPSVYPVGASPPWSASAAAIQAAEEKRRQQVLQQHPALGVLQAHTAKLVTLRLYMENPDFSALKLLTHLPHMAELHVAVCYTSGSDLESEDDMSGDDASVGGHEALPMPAAVAAPGQAASAAAASDAQSVAGAALAGVLAGAEQHAAGSVLPQGASTAGAGAPGHAASTAVPGDQASSRHSQPAGSQTELSPKHIMTILRNLPRLTSLTVREEIPAGEEGSPCSHEQCSLGPASCLALVHSLKHLVHLEWQGLLSAPHPSSLQALASSACLRSLTLVVNQDDPMARLGLHCLPPSLTSLTLQNISVAAAPRGQPHRLPTLCHLHLKSCAVPDICTFTAAPALEWLSLDNCDIAVYVPDLVDLWPSLSWLEVTYTHQDWRLLYGPADLPALGSLTRLRKLSLITPYEDALTTDALLGLTQLRLLSISPSPQLGYEQFMRLAELRFLAGLEVKLYSDVMHHEDLVDMAGAMHADLQEGLPMTDVLIMVDDSYADDPSSA